MKSRLFLAILIILSFQLSAQRFDRADSIPVSENGSPLRNPWAGGINFPCINSVDVNGDGIKDLFIFDKHNFRNTVYLNNGSTNYRNAWTYAPSYNDKFPVIRQWVIMFDYNCDGKEDLFTLSSTSFAAMAVYRNDYTPGTGLQWTLITDYLDESYFNLRQNIFVNGVSLPAFSDIDNDGDMDILGYNSLPDGRIAFHKNYSMEDYGRCDSLDFKYETACYGNFQLLIGGSNQVGCFHCPCRQGRPMESDQVNDALPSYESPSYDQSLAAPLDDTISGIFIFDNDGDGDKDLIIGDIASFNSLLVTDSGTVSSAEMGSQDVAFPSYDVPADFDGFHYHSYFDVDNDGLKDLVVCPNFNENIHGMWFYKNNGTNDAPVFEYIQKSFLQETMIEVGENAAPALFDYDADGLLDLMVGYDEFVNGPNTHKVSMRYYKNVGTNISPAFDLIDSDVSTISQFNFTSPLVPTFGDLDGDGDKDLILGLGDGRLAYFTNTGGAGNPSNFNYVSLYMGIDVGRIATPQIYDLNNDGLNDLIVGEQSGFVNYFKNTGTANFAIFDTSQAVDTLGCIVIQAAGNTDGFIVPFAYDSLGSQRLLVANEDGLIYKYDGIDGNLGGCFHNYGFVSDTAESNRNKFNITVSGGDLNGDGLIDLVIGQSTGGVQVRYQHNGLISVPELEAAKPSMEVYPSPANTNLHLKFYNLSGSQNSIVRLYNSTAILVEEKFVSGNESEIQTASFANGIYFLQLISGNHSTGRKVIVRH